MNFRISMIMFKRALSRLCSLVFFVWLGFICSCKQSRHEYVNHTRWADSVADHAQNLMSGSHPALSLVYLDSVQRATAGLGPADLWRMYNVRSNFYYYNDEFDTIKRKAYLDSMFSLLKGREQEYKFEYAHTMFAEARLLKSEKKYTQAFRVCFDGRIFAQKNLDNCSLGDFSNYLGLIRFQQEEFVAAIPYLKQAFSEVSGCDSIASFNYSFIVPQGILNTIALCFEKAGLPDSAIVYYQKDLDFVNLKKKNYPEKQLFVQTAIGVIEGNLGGTYADLNKLPQAIKYLKESIAINDRPGYAIEDAQTAKTKLISLYITHRYFKQADTLLQQLGYDLANQIGKGAENDYVRQKWYELKWLFYDRTHQLAQAYYYLQKYRAVTDSIGQVNSGLKHADMDQYFASLKQQYQLGLLNKNNEVKSAYLATVVIFLVMAVVVAGTIWYYLTHSAKDVKKLTLLNSRLNNTLAALEQSQEENKRIMNIVVHDLRNPIGAITSMAAMLLETERPEEDRTFLELIRTSGENSLRLVGELLQVNVKQAIEKERLDLKGLLAYCISLLQHKAIAKNQRLELLAESVFIDLAREQMWRLISNLIGNSIKFSPEGAVILVKLEQQPGYVLISVKDQGIGIPDELKDKIFDMFTQAKRSGTAGETSYGLGLAISKQIVETHGGEIWFESAPGKGTTFFITLPLIKF